jgi:hypothetical protein
MEQQAVMQRSTYQVGTSLSRDMGVRIMGVGLNRRNNYFFSTLSHMTDQIMRAAMPVPYLCNVQFGKNFTWQLDTDATHRSDPRKYPPEDTGVTNLQ